MPAVAALILGAGSVMAQIPRFATHDWTPVVGGPEPLDFPEVWADTKAPGDGRIYNVGTIEVVNTFPLTAEFSNNFPSVNHAQPANGLLPFLLGQRRQVVMLQVAAPAGQDVFHQKFYYGNDSDQSHTATNGRGIAVWPAQNDADTRIVICGETQANKLPQCTDQWPGAGSGATSGFIAVFNGFGDLRWSHHFYGLAEGQHCAITDVSVRIVYDASGNPLTDIVTFCGISTYGNPANNLNLTTVAPFAAPTGCSSAGGSTDNGAGQWDGLVGRIHLPHTATTGPATVDFLSVVGGAQQDGLFGLAEFDQAHFAVVGSTGVPGTTPAVGLDFPLTLPAAGCPGATGGTYALGVVAVFEAVSPLVLSFGGTIGELLEGTCTVARDVLATRFNGAGGYQGMWIVGSTNDPNLFSFAWPGVSAPAPQAVYGGGPADGFLLGGRLKDAALAPGWTVFSAEQGTFRGGSGDEGLTGVQAWNEYYDHVAVVGFDSANGGDIDVAGYYSNPMLHVMREQLLGGANQEVPTAMGVVNATVLGGFAEYSLGNPAGGGVTVGVDARVHAVGRTIGSGISVVGGGRGKVGVLTDAVRFAVDMLPPGVGRTDGTGDAVPSGGPIGGYPIAPYPGGTTPECALTPFGHQIGHADPQVPPLSPRMMLDYLGPAPVAGGAPVMVVDRPSGNSGFILPILQIGFPGVSAGGGSPFAPAVLMPDGLVLWTTSSTAVLLGPYFPLSNASLECLLPGALPPSPATFTVQMIFGLVSPITAGLAGSCGGTTTLAASSALWISY